MDFISSPLTTTSYDFHLEDWIDIDTTGIQIDSLGASSSDSFSHDLFGTEFNASSATESTCPISSSNASISSDAFHLLTRTFDSSLSQALDDTSIYSDSPETHWTDFSMAQTEEFPEPLAIESFTLSSAFQDASYYPDQLPPDIVLVSSDSVLFYVPQTTLMSASNNSFGGLLPVAVENKIERVRHLHKVHSSELNVILHILGNTSCAHFNPPLHTISAAIDHLPKYGITPNLWVTKTNPIYDLLLPHVPLYPLDIYCLCGRHDLYELAAVVSPHLLSLNTNSLTDETAEKIGSSYLARLLGLHKSRVETLKNLLMAPPALHHPMKDCGFESQKILSGAWTMAKTYISWCAKPDMPPDAIRGIFDAMTMHITCKECRKERDDRVNKVVLDWTITKNTI